MGYRTLSFFSISLLVCTALSSQNLILNPGFEINDQCPSRIVNMDVLLQDVSLPTSSSGDYFHQCGSEDFSIPENFKGSQKSAEGSGYVGLYFYALNDYREYVQLNTAKKLREKHPYKVSLQVSLAETSKMALKTMSIIMTNKKVKVPNSSVLTHSKLDLQEDVEFHEIALKADKSMAEKEGWVTLTAEFDAKGFENHIIFGNFQTNDNTTLLKSEKLPSSSDFSYYYLDNFVLEELPRVNYEEDKIYVLENNPFEPKGYELDAKARKDIQKIFKYLKENAEVQMKITGHSDNIGTPEYHKFISSLRARAVALHLKKLGIDDNRIVWEGVGDTKPLRNGKIKAKDFENGRIEFVMTKFDDQ
ncbi:OmpA family protein [Flagellimonas nanhaiensis]|uniref:OmpA family protein n=1 Tax=Flagellimonas nanhaiensis TaxID=2292706 RepID=A0A371JST8_9FLAO|nr:OmpA family protein [Allomuricauda nanhaiensis]RDY60819.1 OmpA family protein [Allomuricauda nanhaiensis]